MAEILTQREIETLLSGMGEHGAADASSASPGTEPPREFARFDFRMPRRLSSRQLQTFNAIHDNFAEAFSSFLVSRLQTTVSASVVSVEQMFYSEYVSATARPNCLYVFCIEALGAKAVMEFSPSLVLAVIARMLGGTTELVVETRPITKIEQSIVKSIVQRAVEELQRAWASITESNFALQRYETEPDFIQIAPTSEIVLVVKIEVTLGEHRYGMSLCFPTLPLEGVLATMQTQQNAHGTRSHEQKEWTEAILRSLEPTKLSVTGVLGQATLTLRQLKELEVGDLLITNTPVNGEVHLTIGGRVRARGRPGISNGKTAMKITHILADSDHNG